MACRHSSCWCQYCEKSATVPLGTRGVVIMCRTTPGDGCGLECPWNCLRAPPHFSRLWVARLAQLFLRLATLFSEPLFSHLSATCVFLDFCTPEPPKMTSKCNKKKKKTGTDGLPEKYTHKCIKIYDFITFFRRSISKKHCNTLYKTVFF